jgi:DNA-binding LacI/PurR family transcriptional regulator
MADVARAANVSTATVSRVLRGLDGAGSAETTERVVATAAELGYIVNAVASSMRSRQTRTVGLVLADVSNPWWGQLASGVESLLGPEGFSVILANTDNRVERERAAVETLLRKQVDALIVASSSADGSHLRGAIARGTVVVLVDAELPDLDVDSITIDNEAAARTAVEHLLEFGHEDVAIVHGGTDASFDRGRIAGYQNALAARGLRARSDHNSVGRSTFDGGRAAVVGLLASSPRPSAIFVTNNLMTVGALVAIAEAGLLVPRDVSVVGIDDMEWYPIAQPAISAVYEPAEEMGRRAAERLLLRLRRRRQPRVQRIRLATELRVRRSVGPPAGSIEMKGEGAPA